MDKELLGELLIKSLTKYNFKNYGKKLFYLDLKDSIIILEQLTYMTSAELYLSFIIKDCHPEITKITKNILKDRMIIDSYDNYKLYYNSMKHNIGHDFYDIEIFEFESVIERLYNDYIKPFEKNYLEGIYHYNNVLFQRIKYNFEMKLFKDSASKIGHMELAAYRDHAWFQSDYVILSNKYKLDYRFINDNTAKYIMDNIVKKAPKELEGKELIKWCNEKCKEMFITKRKRRDFGYCSMIFPFIDEKPLKFDGFTRIDNKEVQFYVDEDKGEYYHCTIIDDSNPLDKKYDLVKIER